MCLARMNEVSGSRVIILAALVAHAISGLVLRAIQLRHPTMAGKLIALDSDL